VASAFHAGFPRLGHVAHLNASPFEQFPQAEGIVEFEDNFEEFDIPSVMSSNLTIDSSASSISLRPQLQFLQARFFGAQLSVSSAAFSAADFDNDKVEKAFALALSSRRDSSSIKSVLEFKFFAAIVHVDELEFIIDTGDTCVTFKREEDDDDDDSIDDFPSRSVALGKRVFSFDTAANAGRFKLPVVGSVTKPQRIASSCKIFLKSVFAANDTRSSPPGNSALKALERRLRREPSGNTAVGSVPDISMSRESTAVGPNFLDEFSRTSENNFSESKSITRSIFFTFYIQIGIEF
jgi:hypothetical protein